MQHITSMFKVHLIHADNMYRLQVINGCQATVSFYLVKSKGFAYLAARGLVPMMLHYVIRQDCHTSRAYRAQDRLLRRDKTCPAYTYLTMSWIAL